MPPLQRPPRSAEEIAEIAILGNTQCHAYVRERGAELAAETLVYVMREANQRQDTTLFQLAATHLLGRPGTGRRWIGGHCEPIVVNLAVLFGFGDRLERRVEFRSQCIRALLRAISAGRDAKGYWEERFGDAFRKSCIDEARRMVAFDARHLLGEDASDEADLNWADGVPDPSSDAEENDALAILASLDGDSRLLNATRALPPRQARAVFLRYFDGFAITGKGADTVANVMGISEAGVHKLLNKAYARLRADPNLRGIWPGKG